LILILSGYAVSAFIYIANMEKKDDYG